MHRVVTTPLAILLELNTIRIILLVFLGRIVAAFALGACKVTKVRMNSPLITIRALVFTHELTDSWTRI